MGFKISDFSALRLTQAKLGEISSNLGTKMKNAENTLTEFSGVCSYASTNLTYLKSELSSHSERLSNVLETLRMFLAKQVSSYSSNEEMVAQRLGELTSILDELEV